MQESGGAGEGTKGCRLMALSEFITSYSQRELHTTAHCELHNAHRTLENYCTLIPVKCVLVYSGRGIYISVKKPVTQDVLNGDGCHGIL